MGEFSEKFQTAVDPPPPHFRKVILQFFPEKALFKGLKVKKKKHMREICCLLLTVPLQPVLRGGGQAGELLVVDAHPGHTAGQSHDLCKDLN